MGSNVQIGRQTRNLQLDQIFDLTTLKNLCFMLRFALTYIGVVIEGLGFPENT